MSELVHSKEIKISKEHLDKNDHVNNVQYVHWVEEIAADHWEVLKNKTQYSKDYWVLFDHHIQYKKQVFLGDNLIVKTFPLSPIGIKQPRKVEFYLGEELVVSSDTLWILFDHETQKIKRIDGNWLEELKMKI
ncbi:acyl-ACP thioesterase domain-containing protein [Soonwooa sp.]|uniref:acyl-CoA thioesterase n=1 Tax=Soonwooa sp. TaxID=1938592 RepID=UPI00262C1472|nr:acyl-ACP thioesterase domain-containing protein [Soonwooa sp.]